MHWQSDDEKLSPFVLVENEAHSDFVKLREMLIRTNMEDLRERTDMNHYERYRKNRLEQVQMSILLTY